MNRMLDGDTWPTGPACYTGHPFITQVFMPLLTCPSRLRTCLLSRSLRWSLGSLLLTLVGVLGFSYYQVGLTHRYTYDDVEQIPYNRVALILGTARYLAPGKPNPYFANRIRAAGELYREGKVTYFLVSGDNATLRYNEPREMRRALLKEGIPARFIYSDYAGFRTLDSVVRAFEVFGQRRFTVVSQPFHNERAIYLARHHGLEVIGYNAKDVATMLDLRTRLREILARFKCLLDVYVLEKEPKFLGEAITIGEPASAGTPTMTPPGREEETATQAGG